MIKSGHLDSMQMKSQSVQPDDFRESSSCAWESNQEKPWPVWMQIDSGTVHMMYNDDKQRVTHKTALARCGAKVREHFHVSVL